MEGRPIEMNPLSGGFLVYVFLAMSALKLAKISLTFSNPTGDIIARW
ncbi:MAG: hypothetical protein H6973_04110 [Gammaproteobacteria bacterium]|nr:hypothetical protein [Gammaproteobacteria bacterium]